MLGLAKFVLRSVLDNFALFYHSNRVGNFGNDAQVVGDKHHGHLAAIRNNSRIVACTVTSKAVVGSSAINTAGLHKLPLRSLPAATDRLKVGGDSGQAFLVSAGSPC